MKLVYFIQAGGLVKIGFSYNVDRCLRELQKSAPTARLLAAADLVESAVHARFAHLRKHGEWFDPGEDLLMFVRSIAEPTGKLVRQQKRTGATAFGLWLKKHEISYAASGRAIEVTRAYAQMIATGKVVPAMKVRFKIQAWTSKLDPKEPVTIDTWV